MELGSKVAHTKGVPALTNLDVESNIPLGVTGSNVANSSLKSKFQKAGTEDDDLYVTKVSRDIRWNDLNYTLGEKKILQNCWGDVSNTFLLTVFVMMLFRHNVLWVFI